MARWGSLVDVMSLFELKLSQSLLFSILGLAIFLSKQVPGDGQHYMLSTLYVERRVPGDGQRDYMLTLYSQHYMLTLFLQKIARHYMLII